MDSDILTLINSFAGHYLWLDTIGRFFANDAIYLFGVILLALWFWRDSPARQGSRQVRIINAVGGAAAALLIAHLISLIHYRPRPFVVQPVTLLIAHPPDSSFPSDHTVFVFALVVGLWPILGRMRWPLVAMGALIGIARIFVGVHYPTDVLGGALIGLVCGVVALALVLVRRLLLLEARTVALLALLGLA